VSPYDAFSWPPLSWSGDEMWGRGASFMGEEEDK